MSSRLLPKLLALCFIALLPVVSPAMAAQKQKVIIDQDAFEGPGLQPLLMLIDDPSVDVVGITTVSGDGWQPEETAATLRMLELIGRTDIPVIAGATFPLVNSKERNKRRQALYGPLGYNGAWTDVWPGSDTMTRRKSHGPHEVPPLPEGMPTTKPLPGSAAEFMLAKSREFPGQITIIAMGPLTNLALAQRLDDGFASRIKEVVTEGGRLLGMNTDGKQDGFSAQVAYQPRMSFNHYWDPEASHIVLTSPWPKLTLVTADASAPLVGTRELLDRITSGKGPVSRYVAKISTPGYPLWDETEAAAWLDPSIVTRRGKLAIDVDLMPGANYGALLTWPPGKGPGLGERDVDVIYAVDKAKTESMFVDLLKR